MIIYRRLLNNFKYLFLRIVVLDDAYGVADVEAELVAVLAVVAVRGTHAVQHASRQPRQRRPCRRD